MTPTFGELFLVRGADRDRVEDRVDGHAGEALLLGERDAELLVGLEELRVDFVEDWSGFTDLGAE
jgi:hypothetical protein